MVRIAPAELLDDFEAHRLRAFGVVGAQVDVHEAPAVPVADLRAQPVHVVVVAGDGEDRRPIDRRAEKLSGLEVVRDEHAALDAETRGVRRDAVGEVAGGRTREHVEAEFERAGGGDRHHAILVGERRMVDRVVLDVQLAQAEALGQARAADERREAGVEAGARFTGDRQQLAVAPEILRTTLDLLARDRDRRRSRKSARAGQDIFRRPRGLRPGIGPYRDDTAVR